ncbi:hypothetical protein PG987_013450 [Apiospora arundinis]
MLWAAVRRGRLDFARYLIKTGAKLRTRPESEGERLPALHIAARRGDVAMARLLLEGGARINAEATRIAAERGNEEVLKLFLDHCAARTSGYEQLTDVSDDDDDFNPLDFCSEFDSDGEPYQRRKPRYRPDLLCDSWRREYGVSTRAFEAEGRLWACRLAMRAKNLTASTSTGPAGTPWTKGAPCMIRSRRVRAWPGT